MFWSLLGSIIIIFLLKPDLEWPDKLKIPKFFFEQITGWPAFYGFRSALGNSTDEWEQFWEQLFARTEVPKASREFRGPKCSLINSFWGKCYTREASDCAGDGICSENWMGSRKNVICQDENGQIVNCKGKQRISQVNYNSSAILLKLSNSNHFSILPMPDRATYYYDNITSKFAFIEVSDRSTIYLQKNKKTVIYGKRIFQQSIDGLTKLCLDRRCIEVNQTRDPITDHVHLQYLVDKDKALILVTKNVNETIINMIPRKNDTKTAPYYQRRGRFHCPSEVTCLLEIFYVTKLTDQILIQIIFAVFVLFYLMGNRKHLL